MEDAECHLITARPGGQTDGLVDLRRQELLAIVIILRDLSGRTDGLVTPPSYPLDP
jgi:hypothetical protein